MKTVSIKIVCDPDHPLFLAIMDEFKSGPNSVVRIVSMDDVFEQRDKFERGYNLASRNGE